MTSSGRLNGRLIALGVTGSIAAYKAVELLRLLTAEGADVVTLLSPSATRFVGPLSFAALSRHPVETDVLDLLPDGRIGHIVIADSADAVVVAPATAHFLAAMATGLAGDVVTAACLATSAPVVVAPAMDGDMWTHPATASNVARLHDDFGYTVVAPESGALASGQSGVGRLADLPAIVDAVVAAVSGRPVRQPDAAARPPLAAELPRDADLVGRRVVITAGGTREPIDPVRYIGNRSTGKMGVALAEAALARGATVTLIAAAVEVPLPADATVVRVETTAELGAALADAMGGAVAPDALVMAAAVADFAPSNVADGKISRGDGLTLELSPTPDLLAGVAAAARGATNPPILVGFAAETGSLERAPGKLQAKGIDLLVGNDVSEEGSGFGTDTNRVTIFDRDGGREALPLLSKREVADRVLDRVARVLDARPVDARGGSVQTASSTTARTLDGRPRRVGADCLEHNRAHPGGVVHMSATEPSARRLTVSDIGRMYADGERIPMLTAYDFPTARILDDSGIPMILVGDSLGQVALGYESTVRVTMEEMLHHTRAVVRGTKHALVIGDMPFLSYSNVEEATENAGRFMQDGGAQAVKVEGGVRSARIVEALVKSGVPVMGHIGWTPQSQHGLGGKVRVQGKTRDDARAMLSDAIAIQQAGAFSIVLELVPEQLAAVITSRLRIPTIGIGAGPHCSGQVQVIPDMLGLGDFKPKHARAYADLQGTITAATKAWMADVVAGTFPGPAETVRMDDAVLDEALGRTADDRAPGAVDTSVGSMIPLDRDL